MAQRGEGGGYVRIEALMAVARLSIDDADFLNGLKNDPGETLWRHGFALSPAEMRDVSEYFSRTAGVRDNEIARALRRDLDELAAGSDGERARYWRL